MSRQNHLARMESIISAADAEGREPTAAEQADFDAARAAIDALDANAQRRNGLAALRQQTMTPEQIERHALAPNQSLASLFPRAAGDNRRIGDLIRDQIAPRGEQSIGSGPGGGFVTPSYLSAEIFDLARSRARTIQAGVRTIPVQGATSFATVEEDPAFATHAENQTINETEITFGLRNFVPMTKVALIRASVELVEDSANFNSLVDSVLAAAFATEMDRLALYGNVGEPLGLLRDPAIASVSGATFTTWGPFARAVQSVRSANYTPGAFILSPGALGAVDNLAEAVNGQPLRRPPSLETMPLLDTTAIPDAATTEAITGQFDQYVIALRTPLTIEATRVGGDAFNKLSVLIRAYARMDGFAIRREAFTKVTGIPVPTIG